MNSLQCKSGFCLWILSSQLQLLVALSPRSHSQSHPKLTKFSNGNGSLVARATGTRSNWNSWNWRTSSPTLFISRQEKVNIAGNLAISNRLPTSCVTYPLIHTLLAGKRSCKLRASSCKCWRCVVITEKARELRLIVARIPKVGLA